MTEKQECRDLAEKCELRMSDEKCKPCEHYYECRFMLAVMNAVVYGED